MPGVGDSDHFASRPEAWASSFQGLASSPQEHSSTSAGGAVYNNFHNLQKEFDFNRLHISLQLQLLFSILYCSIPSRLNSVPESDI